MEKIHQGHKLAKGDAKLMVFVSEANFGMGINSSVAVKQLKTIVHKLEIALNGDELASKTMRAWIHLAMGEN